MSAPTRRRTVQLLVLALAAGLLVAVASPGATSPVVDLNASTIPPVQAISPEQLADGGVDGLEHADPTAGLSLIAPPEANSSGDARLSYEIPIPKGRDQPGTTPELSLEYDSGGGSSWVGQGWSLNTGGEISVDTTFGVPMYCPRTTAPACDDVESETYRIDGDLLMPSATVADKQKRVAERGDYTRKQEQTYQRITRHGSGTKGYHWEVRDKDGNVFWYGGHPDKGADTDTSGGPGTRVGVEQNDAGIAPSAILTDDEGNGFTWYLKAQRDIFSNLIRYEYKTVYYLPRSTQSGTEWDVTPKSACEADGKLVPGKCAKHVYLTNIFYAGATETSEGYSDEKGELPGHEIRFITTPGRPDPVLDARGGFLDLDPELLTRIEVRLVADDTPGNGDNPLIATYDLGYTFDDQFNKERLKSITQTGCATDAGCDPSTAATTKVEYYDDVTGTDGFAAPVKYSTGNDRVPEYQGDIDHPQGYESGLGMSRTDAFDGRAYVGFNFVNPTKTGSFGASITASGGNTRSLVELTDINGDGLQDKVFADGDGVSYRLNTAKPGDTGPVMFGEKQTTTMPGMPTQSQRDVKGALEAYFGISGVASVGGGINYGQRYFSDVNADGLADFVRDNQVWFNHLECSTPGSPSTCVPTFTRSSADTRSPLDVKIQGGRTNIEDISKSIAELKKAAPPVDVVRRWVAPYDGEVQISGTVGWSDQGAAPGYLTGSSCTTGDGAIVWIQLEDTVIDKCQLMSGGFGRLFVHPTSVAALTVKKGQRLYFRVSPQLDQPVSAVAFNSTVTYTKYGTGSGAQALTPPSDANGLSQSRFNPTDDFTLAGRQGMFVGTPKDGPLKFEAVIDKLVTSDDLTAEIAHDFGTAGKATVDEQVTVVRLKADGTPETARVRTVEHPTPTTWCVMFGTTTLRCYPTDSEAQAAKKSVLFATEVGKFALRADTAADPAVKDASGQITAQDTFAPRLSATSPVNPQRITFKSVPTFCYPTNGVCGAKSLSFPSPMDVELFPVSMATKPRMASYTPQTSGTGTYDVALDFDTTSYGSSTTREREIWVTFKATDGTALVKTMWVDADSTSGGHRHLSRQVSLPAGKSWWVDVSFRSGGLYEGIAGQAALSPNYAPVLSMRPAGAGAWWVVDSAQFNGPAAVDYFGGGHRGWSVLGYRADDALRTSPIDQSRLRLTTTSGGKFNNKDDACAAVMGARCTSGVKIPGVFNGTEVSPGYQMGSISAQVPNLFAFFPNRKAGTAGSVTETWQGPREAIAVSRTAMSAARFSEVPLDSLAKPDTSGEVAAPTITSETSPSIGISGGVGSLGASFGFTWSAGTVGYLDMNGDGYPDPVYKDGIDYTDSRGGKSCKSGNVLVVCSGPGLGWVNTDTAVSAGAGLNGSVFGVNVNANGTAAGTRGNVANQGGSVDLSYGANIGGNVNVNSTTSSPTVAKPSWSGYRQDISNITGGDPFKEGAVVQRTLADVNGDGLPDQVSTTSAGVFVKLNLGYSFSPDWQPWARSIVFESGSTLGSSAGLGIGFAGPGKDFSGGFARNQNANFANYTWDDVNGDGLLDGLTRDNGRILVRFGNGAGLAAPREYGTFASQQVSVLSAALSTGQQIHQDSSTGYGGGFDNTFGVGPICLAGCYAIFNPGFHYDNTVTLSDVDLTDLNGDGMLDSVARCSFGEIETLECTGEDLNVRYNKQRRTGLLKKVTNPLGGSFTLDYRMAGNTTDHPDSSWVLSEVTVDDGRPGNGADTQKSLFSYAGPRYDFVNRDDLGFAEVITEQVDTENVPASGPPVTLRTTRETFSNTNVFDAGLPLKAEVYDGKYVAGQTGNLVRSTTNSWEIRSGATDQNMPATMSANLQLSSWARPLLVSVLEVLRYDGNEQRSETLYTYDAMGNPTLITDRGDWDDAADDTHTLIVWSNCDISASDKLKTECGPVSKPELRPAFWSPNSCPSWVSVPATIKVVDWNGNILRYRDASPDLCGNLIPTEQNELISGDPDNASSAVWATTRMQFDSWGNYSLIVFPLGANGKHYTVQNEYDPVLHTAVVRSTDYDLDPTLDGDHDGKAQPDGKWECSDETLTTAEPEAGRCPDLEQYLGYGAVEPSSDPSSGLPTPPDASRGLTSTAVYDARLGRVTVRRNANGNRTGYGFDGLGRVAAKTMADGGWVTFEYQPSAPGYAYALARNSDELRSGNPIETATFVDGMGRVTQTKEETAIFRGVGQTPLETQVVSGYVEYDALGRVRKQWQPTGNSSLRHFVTTKDPDPPRTVTYNVLDEPVRTVETDGRVITWNRTMTRAENPLPQTLYKVTETDPEQRSTVTYTDVRGNVRVVKDVATGKVTTYDVDPLGQVLQVAQAGENQMVNTYDLRGLRTSSATQDSGKVTFNYDAIGNLVAKQTEAMRALGSYSTKYTYGFNKMTDIDYPDGVLQNTPDVHFTWGGYGSATAPVNGKGRVTNVDDGVKEQTLEYDNLGNVVRQDVKMKNSAWGNLETKSTSFDYDWLGRPLWIQYPDLEKVTNDYDTGGRLSKVTGTIPGESAYSYLADRQYDVFGYPAFEELGNGTRTQYVRNSENLWLERKVETSPRQVRVSVGTTTFPLLDATTKFVTVDELFEPPVVPFTAKIDGEEVQVTERQKVPSSRLALYTLVRGTNGSTAAGHVTGSLVSVDRVQQNLRYTYDKAGNVTKYVNDLPPDTSALMGGRSEQTYTLDGAYRIKYAAGTWSSTKPKSYTQTLDYQDPSGNLTKKVQTDTSGTSAYTFDPITYGGAGGTQHRIAQQGNRVFSYDPNGNVTRITMPTDSNCRNMTWNADNRMTSIKDGPANCNTGGSATTFEYDYTGTLTAELKGQGGIFFVNPWVTYEGQALSKHIFADGDRIATRSKNKLYFLHSDLQGSTNIVTDDLGAIYQHFEYFPNGEKWVDETSNTFRTQYLFAGEYSDEGHGTSDLGQRWLDSKAQVFYGADPAPMDDPTALVSDAGLASSYTYANNNPLAYTDPDGRRAFRLIALRRERPAKWSLDNVGSSIDQALWEIESGQSGYHGFLLKHPPSTSWRGRLTTAVWRSFGRLNQAQDVADWLEIKPVVSLNFEAKGDQWTFNVKGSAGFGPQAASRVSSPFSSRFLDWFRKSSSTVGVAAALGAIEQPDQGSREESSLVGSSSGTSDHLVSSASGTNDNDNDNDNYEMTSGGNMDGRSDSSE